MLMSPNDRPASLHYSASSFKVISAGQYVNCAVTAEQIPLEELRYWSAERQEAYASAEIATRRLTGAV